MKTEHVHPVLANVARPTIIAHRGFVSSADAAEGIFDNTRAAFEAALAAGADVLESDARLTSDGELVLFHDETLQRFTGEAIAVHELSHGELSTRFRDRGGLMTVRDALEIFPQATFNIDVTVAAAAEIAGRAVAPHGHRVLITSFDDATRRRALDVARETPGASTLPATSGGRGTIARLVAMLALPRPLRPRGRLAKWFAELDAIQIPERYGQLRVLTPDLVREAHAHGVQVHVWTVNDPERMTQLVRAGIDGIVTDRTDLARQAFT